MGISKEKIEKASSIFHRKFYDGGEFLGDAIKATLEALIDDEPTEAEPQPDANGWYRVEDKLPEVGPTNQVECIILPDGDRREYGFYSTKGVWRSSWDHDEMPVTHWRYIKDDGPIEGGAE